LICEIEKDDEHKIILKQTKTRPTSINQIRKESLYNLKIQVTKMTEMSKIRICRRNIEESVRVKIPDVDRARSYPRCSLRLKENCK